MGPGIEESLSLSVPKPEIMIRVKLKPEIIIGVLKAKTRNYDQTKGETRNKGNLLLIPCESQFQVLMGGRNVNS